MKQTVRLHNRHAESRWYHPITMMCYRKNGDDWEFYKDWVMFRGDIWGKSGMKTGFKLINTQH